MAFPLTPEAALCSCFRILLQDLAPILRSKDLLSFWEIDRELKNFLMKISKVQDLLNNAEERRKEICVNNWMDNLRELSYEMENLVDKMNNEHVRMEQKVAHQNQAGTSHHVVHRYTFWDNIPDSSRQKDTIKKRMNDALARLDKVLMGAKDLELKPEAVGRSPVSSIANRVEDDVGASVDESDVYGRQKDKDIVIQELLSSSSKKNYSTISIVGMGGVGKTTLARLIFHDQRVKNFDVRSWACVSDAFDAKKVVKDLIEYATDKNVSNMAAAALRRRLEDMVKGKKILIVLDDIWEVKAWDSLKVSFTHCAEGSKILVTTRNKHVGNSIGNKESYELKTLEDDDCWHLFKGIAFGEVVDENLEKMGREIVKKCKGVPLAVKVIGSTLRFASAESWENALRNDLWQLEDGANDEILPALKLSYHYLPSSLKRCFGYLSLLPTDYELDQYKVVRLWLAEGFIESRKGRSWEDIGHEYYKELQRRGLVQEDNKMHDLIHSLACTVFGKFSYRIADGTNSCIHMESVQHLSVSGKDVDLEALDKPKHLRTLFLFNGHFSEKIFGEHLRVLYLENTTLQELPRRLKCLRYLDLSWSQNIECLPDSICELQNLQTLDLQGCSRLRKLPNDIGDLQKLRYICLSSTLLSGLPTSTVKLLDYLELDLSCIPEDIMNLVSLRELHLARTPISSLPDSICNLKKLRVLNLNNCNSFYNLPNEIGALQDLRELNLSFTLISHLPKSIGNLHNLRNLDICGCERLAQLPEDIGKLVSLQELHLVRASISSLPDSICKLKKLRVLNLKDCNSISSLPDEIGAVQDLMELDLCATSISHLPKSVGNLHNLRSLDIRKCEKLTQLSEDICNLSSLENFEFDKNLLPRGIGRLRNIKRLDKFVVGKEEGWGIEELNGMNKLKGSLTISQLENVVSVEMARTASLKSKIHINHLYFEWSSMDDASDVGGIGLTTSDGETEANVVEALEPYPTGLVALSLKNYHGERVPMWMANLRFPSLEELTMDGLPCVERVMDMELPSLKFLGIENCPKLRVVSMGLPNLQGLRVSSCQELTTLCMIQCQETFSYASEIRSLQEIHIIKCPGLVHFLDKGLPPMLRELEIESCTSLRHLPRGLQHSTSLHSLLIRDCPKLVSFTEEELPPKLQRLQIASCTTLRHLPRGLQHNTSLQLLRIEDFPELVSFPDEGLPPMLELLEIGSCKNLGHLLRGLWHNTSLRSLKIKDCPDLVSFPEEGLPPMLQNLSIINCTNLQHLPTGLRDLTSLKTLTLDSCPVLGVRSVDQLPFDLRPEIVNCSKLEQQLKDEDRKKSSFEQDLLTKRSSEPDWLTQFLSGQLAYKSFF